MLQVLSVAAVNTTNKLYTACHFPIRIKAEICMKMSELFFHNESQVQFAV